MGHWAREVGDGDAGNVRCCELADANNHRSVVEGARDFQRVGISMCRAGPESCLFSVPRAGSDGKGTATPNARHAVRCRRDVCNGPCWRVRRVSRRTCCMLGCTLLRPV